MKVKIRVLLMVTAVVMALSMCACDSSTSSKKGDSKTLNIWAWGADDEAKAREEAIKIFIKNHPELNVKYTIIPTADGVWDEKASAALASGSAGDVIQMSPDYFGMNSKYYLDLNSYVKEDNIDLDSVITEGLITRYYNTDDQLEGLPLHTNCFVMAYNKEMFDDAGVDYPTDDWTWADVEKMAPSFAKGSGAEAQFAMVRHWVITNFCMYSAGGTPYTDDLSKSNMGSKEVLDGVILFNNLVKTGGMPNDTTQDTIPASTMFYNGQAAMYPIGGFEAEMIVTEAEEAGVQVGIVAMPKTTTGKDINIQYATGWAITKASKNPDAAWQFIKESSFDNEEMGKVNAKVGIPANKKVAENHYANITYGKTQLKNTLYLEAVENAYLNPWGGTLSSSGDLWKKMWESITLEGIDPAKAQKTFAPQIENEFSNYAFNK